MSRRRKPYFVALILGMVFLASSGWAVDLEMVLKAKSPSLIAWSPNEKLIAFQVSGAKGSDIMLYSVDRRETKTLVSGLPRLRYFKEHPDLRWTPNGKYVIYSRGKEYFKILPHGGNPEPLVSGSLLGELVQLSPDQKKICFIRNGDFWLQPVAGGMPKRLTRGNEILRSAGELHSRFLQWPQWSPDSTKIAYLIQMKSGFKVSIISVEGEEVATIVPEEDLWITYLNWAPDSQKIAITRLSNDRKRKELWIASVSGDNVYNVWKETDERLVSYHYFRSYGISWSSDSRRLTFISGLDGWKHIYLADLHAGKVKQLTDGEFEVYWSFWFNNDKEIIFCSNQGNFHQKNIWRISLKGGPVRPLFEKKGVYSNLTFSPGEKQLAYVFSDSDSVDGLYLSNVSGLAAVLQCYSSLPEGVDERKLGRVEAVQFKSFDGTVIPAVRIAPRDLDHNRNHPALVHMYGGWGQQAIQGLHVDLFGYLVSKGYVILIVDPRGSEGYGRYFTKAVYREAAGKQVEDMASAAQYLAGLSFIDPEGIGIYGRSYGGYLALQTVLQFPEAYAACIVRAGVFDLPKYFSIYEYYAIMKWGYPDEKPYSLLEKNPVDHVDKLKASLLFFHGTHDFNVPIGQSETLVKALIKAGKDFEYMVYPDEVHKWDNPNVIRDYYQRIEKFLDKHLTQ